MIYWLALDRSIRIEGKVERLSLAASEDMWNHIPPWRRWALRRWSKGDYSLPLTPVWDLKSYLAFLLRSAEQEGQVGLQLPSRGEGRLLPELPMMPIYVLKGLETLQHFKAIRQGS